MGIPNISFLLKYIPKQRSKVVKHVVEIEKKIPGHEFYCEGFRNYLLSGGCEVKFLTRFRIKSLKERCP